MKHLRLYLLVVFLAASSTLFGQLEKVFVETYYVSDTTDATDTTGGGLLPGSVTYRIYVDLAPGTKLTKLYADALHALRITGSTPFFNNLADGQTFAKDFSKVRYGENTVALDSWITLGQTTRAGTKTWFGVPKEQDNDGSFIGGVNNDGGSSGVAYGLLNNHDPSAGPALTSADGMDTMVQVPANWVNYGFLDQLSGEDSTILGSLVAGTGLHTNNAMLANSGTTGVNPDSNQVLVAQLTLHGTITFELNVETLEQDGAGWRPVKYVARLAPGETNSDTLKVSPFLTFPPVCGCTDPRYVEYDASYACNDPAACQNLVVFGCMDPAACNYDPNANYNVQSLCCYPGLCQDRDISEVCPQLVHKREMPLIGSLHPNPARNVVYLDLAGDDNNIRYEIYNALGELVVQKDLGVQQGNLEEALDVSAWKGGIYMLRVQAGDRVECSKFIRE